MTSLPRPSASSILLTAGNQTKTGPQERGKGMALYKRGQIWWMRLRYQGRQIRRSTETTNKQQAERIYGRVLGLIAEGKWFDRPPGHDKRVTDMLDRYLKEHSAPNKAATTHRRDQSLA